MKAYEIIREPRNSLFRDAYLSGWASSWNQEKKENPYSDPTLARWWEMGWEQCNAPQPTWNI